MTVPKRPTDTVLRRVMRRAREERRQIRGVGGVRVWLMYFPGPGPRLMSWLRRRWVVFRNPHAHIEFRGPVYIGPRFSLDMPRGGTFVVGAGVEFRRGFRAEFAASDTRITIGDRSVFTYDALIQCTTSINIGAHCMFGQASLVVDGNHRFRDLDRPLLEQGYDFNQIVISDHAVIGTKSTVFANVGERAFVSANTLVGKDVPPYCVVAGVPARVIEYFGPPGQEPRGVRSRPAPARAPSEG